MLERLRELLPPPAEPVEPGRPDSWPAVEATLGTRLPRDFKAFAERYGSGKVDDFLYLFNPFAAGQDGNLPLFPEHGGVLPLGRTDNGDELYWVTDGDPDDWPVALLASRAALQELHRLPVTGFLGRAGRQPARLLHPSEGGARSSEPPVHPSAEP